MEERLQKILSERGVASRRKAEELIEQGKVKVNGHVAKLGDKADARRDVIHVQGKKLAAAEAPARPVPTTIMSRRRLFDGLTNFW